MAKLLEHKASPSSAGCSQGQALEGKRSPALYPRGSKAPLPKLAHALGHCLNLVRRGEGKHWLVRGVPWGYVGMAEMDSVWELNQRGPLQVWLCRRGSARACLGLLCYKEYPHSPTLSCGAWRAPAEPFTGLGSQVTMS